MREIIQLNILDRPAADTKHVLCLCGYIWNSRFGWHHKPKSGYESVTNSAKALKKLAHKLASDPEDALDDAVALAATMLLEDHWRPALQDAASFE